MALKLGSNDITTAYFGSSAVSQMYQGSTALLATFSPDDIADLQLWYDISNASSYPGTGTTIYDLKQIRNASYRDATIVGSFTYDATDGYIDKGGASNDRITMSANSSHPLASTNGITTSVWVWIDAYYGNYSRIIRHGNTSNANQYTFGRWNNTNDHAIYNRSVWYNTNVPTVFSTWTNFTITVDNSNNYVIYRDATSIDSGTLDSIGLISTTYIFDILGTTNNEVTEGRFGAAYVYDRVLNSTEVTELYNGTNRY